MSVVLRSGSPRRLVVMADLALMWLVLAPSASGAAPLDTVTATGTAAISPNQGIPLPAHYTVTINAQSGTSGQNPSGTASFTLESSAIPGSLTLAGPVTCLNVLGPDRGAGTPGSPTIAVLTFRNTTTTTFSDDLRHAGGQRR